MSDPHDHRSVSAGKRWRHFAAGDPAGSPLAEWVYFTPRFAEGIGQSELQAASAYIQGETALVWFGLNFEPYSVGGGPYLGLDRTSPDNHNPAGRAALNTAAYASAPYATAPYAGRVYGRGGYGRGRYGGSPTQPETAPQIAGSGHLYYAPAPLEAAAVLSVEFGVVLPDSVIAEVAHRLPGHWMWRQQLAPYSIDPTGTPPDRAELSSAILTRLDALEEALRGLRPDPGEIGHNGPPEGFGLTPEDEREARAAISRVRAAVAPEGEASGAELQAAADTLGAVGAKLGTWTLGQLNTFITEANKAAAQEAGKALVRGILAAVIIRQLTPLLELAARVVGHH